MRKALAGLGLAAAASAAIVIPSASAASHTIKVTQTITGAQISSTQAVFKVHNSYFGNGAGVQTLKIKGSKVTERAITYYAHGTGTAVGTTKIGPADAQGISTLTGSGHSIGGTGALAGVKFTFTVKGTFNTKTLVYHAHVTGTLTTG